MNCLLAFAMSNPSNAGVKSSHGSTRLEYLIKYLVFQHRAATSRLEYLIKYVVFQQRKATAKMESVSLGTGKVFLDDVLPAIIRELAIMQTQ